MSGLGVGEVIYDLRKRIQHIQSELDALGGPISDMPELIISANILRTNEHLNKVSKKQSELLSLYEQYCKALEGMIEVIFDIQNGLKNILKEQSNLISNRKFSRLSHTPKNKRKHIRKSSKKI
ncbi:MAG: hypothetical protein ACREAK_03605 [Nitrosarchaeum sp.]